MKKIVITGSSGFIGSQLTKYFQAKGDELVLLSRKPQGPQGHYWNPDKALLDPQLLENADVVIHLAGENILGRWNNQKKDQIRESRYISTQFLCDTILNLTHPPKIYIGASAIHYYGDREDEVVTENTPEGEGFLAEVCSYWERIPKILTTKSIRVLAARFGIVLGHGGALSYLEKTFLSGMGGVLGNGKQIMSWIAIDDLCMAIDHLIHHSEMSGPVNFVAPESLSNQAFTEILGALLNRPTLIPIPKFALSLLFGEGAEIFLASTHAKPEKLLDSGYIFKFPSLEPALKHYMNIE